MAIAIVLGCACVSNAVAQQLAIPDGAARFHVIVSVQGEVLAERDMWFAPGSGGDAYELHYAWPDRGWGRVQLGLEEHERRPRLTTFVGVPPPSTGPNAAPTGLGWSLSLSQYLPLESGASVEINPIPELSLRIERR